MADDGDTLPDYQDDGEDGIEAGQGQSEVAKWRRIPLDTAPGYPLQYTVESNLIFVYHANLFVPCAESDFSQINPRNWNPPTDALNSLWDKIYRRQYANGPPAIHDTENAIHKLDTIKRRKMVMDVIKEVVDTYATSPDASASARRASSLHQVPRTPDPQRDDALYMVNVLPPVRTLNARELSLWMDAHVGSGRKRRGAPSDPADDYHNPFSLAKRLKRTGARWPIWVQPDPDRELARESWDSEKIVATFYQTDVDDVKNAHDMSQVFEAFVGFNDPQPTYHGTAITQDCGSWIGLKPGVGSHFSEYHMRIIMMFFLMFEDEMDTLFPRLRRVGLPANRLKTHVQGEDPRRTEDIERHNASVVESIRDWCTMEVWQHSAGKPLELSREGDRGLLEDEAAFNELQPRSHPYFRPRLKPLRNIFRDVLPRVVGSSPTEFSLDQLHDQTFRTFHTERGFFKGSISTGDGQRSYYARHYVPVTTEGEEIAAMEAPEDVTRIMWMLMGPGYVRAAAQPFEPRQFNKVVQYDRNTGETLFKQHEGCTDGYHLYLWIRLLTSLVRAAKQAETSWKPLGGDMTVHARNTFLQNTFGNRWLEWHDGQSIYDLFDVLSPGLNMQNPIRQHFERRAAYYAEPPRSSVNVGLHRVGNNPADGDNRSPPSDYDSGLPEALMFNPATDFMSVNTKIAARIERVQSTWARDTSTQTADVSTRSSAPSPEPSPVAVSRAASKETAEAMAANMGRFTTDYGPASKERGPYPRPMVDITRIISPTPSEDLSTGQNVTTVAGTNAMLTLDKIVKEALIIISNKAIASKEEQKRRGTDSGLMTLPERSDAHRGRGGDQQNTPTRALQQERAGSSDSETAIIDPRSAEQVNKEGNQRMFHVGAGQLSSSSDFGFLDAQTAKEREQAQRRQRHSQPATRDPDPEVIVLTDAVNETTPPPMRLERPSRPPYGFYYHRVDPVDPNSIDDGVTKPDMASRNVRISSGLWRQGSDTSQPVRSPDSSDGTWRERSDRIPTPTFDDLMLETRYGLGREAFMEDGSQLVHSWEVQPISGPDEDLSKGYVVSPGVFRSLANALTDPDVSARPRYAATTAEFVTVVWRHKYTARFSSVPLPSGLSGANKDTANSIPSTAEVSGSPASQRRLRPRVRLSPDADDVGGTVKSGNITSMSTPVRGPLTSSSKQAATKEAGEQEARGLWQSSLTAQKMQQAQNQVLRRTGSDGRQTYVNPKKQPVRGLEAGNPETPTKDAAIKSGSHGLWEPLIGSRIEASPDRTQMESPLARAYRRRSQRQVGQPDSLDTAPVQTRASPTDSKSSGATTWGTPTSAAVLRGEGARQVKNWYRNNLPFSMRKYRSRLSEMRRPPELDVNRFSSTDQPVAKSGDYVEHKDEIPSGAVFELRLRRSPPTPSGTSEMYRGVRSIKPQGSSPDLQLRSIEEAMDVLGDIFNRTKVAIRDTMTGSPGRASPDQRTFVHLPQGQSDQIRVVSGAVGPPRIPPEILTADTVMQPSPADTVTVFNVPPPLRGLDAALRETTLDITGAIGQTGDRSRPRFDEERQTMRSGVAGSAHSSLPVGQSSVNVGNIADQMTGSERLDRPARPGQLGHGRKGDAHNKEAANLHSAFLAASTASTTTRAVRRTGRKHGSTLPGQTATEASQHPLPKRGLVTKAPSAPRVPRDPRQTEASGPQQASAISSSPVPEDGDVPTAGTNPPSDSIPIRTDQLRSLQAKEKEASVLSKISSSESGQDFVSARETQSEPGSGSSKAGSSSQLGPGLGSEPETTTKTEIEAGHTVGSDGATKPSKPSSTKESVAGLEAEEPQEQQDVPMSEMSGRQEMRDRATSGKRKRVQGTLIPPSTPERQNKRSRSTASGKQAQSSPEGGWLGTLMLSGSKNQDAFKRLSTQTREKRRPAAPSQEASSPGLQLLTDLQQATGEQTTPTRRYTQSRWTARTRNVPVTDSLFSSDQLSSPQLPASPGQTSSRQPSTPNAQPGRQGLRPRRLRGAASGHPTENTFRVPDSSGSSRTSHARSSPTVPTHDSANQSAPTASNRSSQPTQGMFPNSPPSANSSTPGLPQRSRRGTSGHPAANTFRVPDSSSSGGSPTSR